MILKIVLFVSLPLIIKYSAVLLIAHCEDLKEVEVSRKGFKLIRFDRKKRKHA